MNLRMLFLAVVCGLTSSAALGVTLSPDDFQSLTDPAGTLFGTPGIIDDTNSVASPNNLVAFGEYQVTLSAVPTGSIISSAFLTFTLDDSAGGSTGASAAVASYLTPFANGTIAGTDLTAPLTGAGLGAYGTNNIDVSVLVRSLLGAGAPALPTTNVTPEFLGFRWDAVGGPSLIGGGGTGGSPVLTINLASDPPIAEANGPYDFGGVTPNLSENFSSAGSDTVPTGGSLSYDWDITGGATNLSAASPSVTLAQTGLTQPGDSTTVNLTVTDTSNTLTGSDTATITYTNNTPTANAAPTTTAVYDSSMLLASSRSFTGAGSTDPDLAMNSGIGSVPGFEALSYTWTFGSNTTSQVNAVTLAQAFAQGLSPNTSVNLQLTVQDNAVTPASDSLNTPLTLTYQNATPTVTGPVAVSDGSGGFDISVNVGDLDFTYFSTLFNGYDEGLSLEAWATGGGPNVSLGTDITSFQTAGGLWTLNVPLATYTGLVGGNYNQFFFTATDSSGAVGISSLQFFEAPQSVPEPATLAVWSALGVALIGYGLRRRRNK